ncbi:hypothetical protein SARC_04812 [Sphaeroforma arctica JP610]|uniref:Uncharacterized protein n=1 Tax=Sphaeroforma arctica JP610 TaxID=667725 RepID=A0A0L0G255_9EUKA|nr:hypothetical protein SARC_04812 [Sphaeroforma arctica JP610]KNC82919.1 hypothetical protein SARC_04812 [Sphaeroforma arctica JP610]|eukprot:XP_014156821.1 hypothetical protein SARC_04812 [Sphaeroforma arctica JP610]
MSPESPDWAPADPELTTSLIVELPVTDIAMPHDWTIVPEGCLEVPRAQPLPGLGESPLLLTLEAQQEGQITSGEKEPFSLTTPDPQEDIDLLAFHGNKLYSPPESFVPLDLTGKEYAPSSEPVHEDDPEGIFPLTLGQIPYLAELLDFEADLLNGAADLPTYSLFYEFQEVPLGTGDLVYAAGLEDEPLVIFPYVDTLPAGDVTLTPQPWVRLCAAHNHPRSSEFTDADEVFFEDHAHFVINAAGTLTQLRRAFCFAASSAFRQELLATWKLKHDSFQLTELPAPPQADPV